MSKPNLKLAPQVEKPKPDEKEEIKPWIVGTHGGEKLPVDQILDRTKQIQMDHLGKK